MTDLTTIVTRHIDEMRAGLVTAAHEQGIAVGFLVEASNARALIDRLDTTVRDSAHDEGRDIVDIDLGGVLRTDEGLRCWGTLILAASGSST